MDRPRLGFTTRTGRPVEPRNLARSFHRIVTSAGLRPIRLHSLRHTTAPYSEVSGDMPIEHISRLVGHSSTTTTETIHRKQIRPVIMYGADVMDRIFPGEADHDA
jgi:integrase